MQDSYIQELERILGRGLTGEELRLLQLAKTLEEQVARERAVAANRYPALQPAR